MPISDYTNVQAISVPAGRVGSDLTNFPVILNFNGHNVFDVLTDDSLRFKMGIFDSSGTEKVVQLAYFDSASRQGFFVFANTLTTATETTWQWGFDADAADNTAFIKDIDNTNLPWVANYKAAWVFSQSPTTPFPTLTDVAGGTWGMHASGSMTSDDLIDGLTGKAIEFDGNDDYYYGSTANMNISGACTWVVMIKPGGSLPGGRIMGKHKDPAGNYGWEIVRNANDALELGLSSDGTAWAVGTTASDLIPDDEWAFAAFVWDGSIVKLYINGVETVSGGFPMAYAAAAIHGTGQQMRISKVEQHPEYYGGVTQHASISVIERSSDWIYAEYLNLSGGLVSFNDFSNGKIIRKTSFNFVITGTPDSTTDATVDSTNFQATRYDGGQSSIQVTIPNADIHGAIFTARPNGELVINAVYEYTDGTESQWEIIRTPFDQIIPNYGGNSTSLQVSGSQAETYTGGGIKTLPGVNYTSASPAGNLNIRMNALMPGIRPKDTVTYKDTSGGDQSIVVKKISMSVSADTQTFTMTE